MKLTLLFSCMLLVFLPMSWGQDNPRVIIDQPADQKVQTQAAPFQYYPFSGSHPLSPLYQQRTGNSQTFRTSGGQQGLPISPNGKVLSPEGYEIDFEIPRSNISVPFGCATPIPVINDPLAASRANCPITDLCDVAATRDLAIPSITDSIKYFKLRWTVIDNGTANSNIDQTRINNLIAELNTEFLPWRIQFCADAANFVTDLGLYSIDINTDDASLKSTYGDSTVQMINIYVIGAITTATPGGSGQIAGYAYFPNSSFGGTNSRGGVVMARIGANVGSHVFAHEMGHVFGLHHTFHGVDEVSTCTSCYERVTAANGSGANGDTEGDWCSDTNPTPTNAFVCTDPAGPANVCDAFVWNNTPVDNHMSYSNCRAQFSSQQAGRMHCFINSYLNSWVNFGNATCGNAAPQADFSGTPTTYPEPANVNFTDLTSPSGLVTSWEWEFDVNNTGLGTVTPATFTGQTPPTVVYPNAGSYTVSLKVFNANGDSTVETKNNYITVVAAASDCDTLHQQWLTPTPSPNIYQWSAGNYVTGLPNLFGDTAYYERFFTPTPGVTTVGAIRVGLASFADSDSSTRFNLLIYNDDGSGFPDIAAGALGGFTGLQPALLNVPPPSIPFFTSPYIPLATPVVVDSSRFHIGIQFYNQDPLDSLVLMTSSVGQGEADSSNHSDGSAGLLKFYGNNGAFTSTIDFDLLLYPVLGEWVPTPVVTGALELPLCDTTFFQIVDTVVFSQTLTSITITYPDSSTFTTVDPNEVDTILLVLTDPPPASLSISTVNSCGRKDTTRFIINHTFRASPNPDFTKLPLNPLCIDSIATFTATPAFDNLYARYIWDFGDGTIDTVTDADTVRHIYSAIGQYYVSLTLQDTFGCSTTIQKLGFSEVVDCDVTVPASAFSLNPTTGCPTDTITFTDASTGSPDPATSWFWDFGDGNVSTLQNPKHLFSNTGTYTVTQYAINAGGSDTSTQTITITPCPLTSDVVLSALPVAEDVGLYWSLPTPGTGLIFDLERSVDGQIFERLETIKGQEDQHYQYLDRQAIRQGSRLWYRLRILDQEGSTNFSNRVAVELNLDKAPWLRIFPNPIQPQQSLQIALLLDRKDMIRVRLMDLTGKTVFTEYVEMKAGLQTHSLTLPDLSSGVYLLEVNAELGQREVRKLVIE